MNISDPAFRLEVQLKLPEDEVHLWRVDLAAAAAGEQRWKQVLSEDERRRAARFHFSRDREYFTATRALLRTILGNYAARDPTQLVFCYSDNEKPSLSPDSGRGLEFNVSHSGTTAVLAFTRGRALGVDVEQLREDFDHDAIARRFFSAREVQQLAALDPTERYPAFFRCWTRKEAYIKAVGTGLSLPLHQFDVSVRPDDGNALLSTRPDSEEAARWILQEVPAGKGYVAALCVRGQGWSLKSWAEAP
jgi:4'-phosphopantetheinyl transferase